MDSNNLLKNINRAISVLEIVGGFLGIFSVFYLAYALPNEIFQELFLPEGRIQKIFFVAIFVFGFSGYILSVVAGIYLWRQERRGYILSIIVQALQTPIFVIGGLSYIFISGLELAVYFTYPMGGIMTYLGSQWQIAYYPGDPQVLLGVNVVSLVILVYLVKVYKKIKLNQSCPPSTSSSLFS